MLLVIKFPAWCQKRKILLRQERVKLKYGIILFILSFGGPRVFMLCKFSHSSHQQERMCTHFRKPCTLEKNQDLNFIKKQEGFLPFLGESTGSALMHISQNHHRSRLFQDCTGLGEVRRHQQLIRKIDQDQVHGSGRS